MFMVNTFRMIYLQQRLHQFEESAGRGAHDLIKRCEKILTDYENRLHLVEHFQKVKKTVASIHTCAEEIAECDDKSVVREKIAQIAELSSKILEEY